MIRYLVLPNLTMVLYLNLYYLYYKGVLYDNTHNESQSEHSIFYENHNISRSADGVAVKM